LSLRARDFLPLLFYLDGPFFRPFVGDRGRRLRLGRSPRRSHTSRKSRLRVVCSVENGGTKNGPGNRSAHKDRHDRDDSLQHNGLCLDSLRRFPNLPRLIGLVKYFSVQSIVLSWLHFLRTYFFLLIVEWNTCPEGVHRRYYWSRRIGSAHSLQAKFLCLGKLQARRRRV
jgi:hypothetical protein